MKINLDGKTQQEIEMMFSEESLLETIATEADIFINEMQPEHFDLLQDIVGENDVEELMLYLIGVIANPMVYSLKRDGFNFKTTRSVIVGLAFSRFMRNNYPDQDEAFRKSFDIVLAMDDILYDIEYVNVKQDNDEYVKIAHCKIGFELDATLATMPDLAFFKIPLLEEPKDWTEYESGGYYLNNTKSTLNRGSDFEPQSVLGTLNILQSNAYTLTSEAYLENLQEATTEKLMKKYDYHFAESITKNITKSAGLVFNTMQNRKFYFEWKFDFRGRLYSTGYDINLQGDKFRKGILTPVIEGRVTIK